MNSPRLRDRLYRNLEILTIVGTLVILVVLLFVVRHHSAMVTGTPLYDRSNGGEPLAESIKAAQDFFSGFTALVTTAFGALAFLISFQQKRQAPLTRGARICMAGALLTLIISLMLSLLGIETLLSMVGNNAVDLGIRGLRIVRWLMYIAFVAAALFLMWFALEIIRPVEVQPASATLDDHDPHSEVQHVVPDNLSAA